MTYSFLLNQHSNIHYREVESRLGCCELSFMLKALGIETEVHEEKIGDAVFLTFSSDLLNEKQLQLLSRHSTVLLMTSREGELLRPLTAPNPRHLSSDLPEVLKYKGKTGVAFTRMMLNTVLSLTPFFTSDTPLLVLDPMCGKATTLFCALEWGMRGVGMDPDKKAVNEARDFFTRYLKLHMMKHSVRNISETVGNQAVPAAVFSFGETKDSITQNGLRLFCGDSMMIPSLMKKEKAHVLVADLPYGIQHAPQNGTKPESFASLLNRLLPAWREALVPEGAIALSYNVLTISPSLLKKAVENSGFTIVPTASLRHDLEQAVVRDVLFALRSPINKP